MTLAETDRFEEVLNTLHAAEKRQLALPGNRRLASQPRHRLLHVLLQQVIEIHQLAAASSSDVQRSMLEARCADTSIVLALIASKP